MSTKFPANPETFHLFLLLPYHFVPMSFSAMLDKERVPKKCCKKSGLFTNSPRPLPPYRFALFLNKKNYPNSFLRMKHLCVKQILHLIPSQNLNIWFCYIWASHFTPIHYITLKAFAMILGDGTKCKTCSGCPGIVLCGRWNFFLSIWFGKRPEFWQHFLAPFPKIYIKMNVYT